MELDNKALALFTEGYTKILEGIGQLGYDVGDENFAETAARAAKGFHELVHDQRQVEFQVNALLAKTFPAKYTEMVISKHNTAFGICPHHLLPVIYRISMAYIPTEKVLGLSKLSRLARMIARGPRLQEDLTHELADILHLQLQSQASRHDRMSQGDLDQRGEPMARQVDQQVVEVVVVEGPDVGGELPIAGGHATSPPVGRPSRSMRRMTAAGT